MLGFLLLLRLTWQRCASVNDTGNGGATEVPPYLTLTGALGLAWRSYGGGEWSRFGCRVRVGVVMECRSWGWIVGGDGPYRTKYVLECTFA